MSVLLTQISIVKWTSKQFPGARLLLELLGRKALPSLRSEHARGDPVQFRSRFLSINVLRAPHGRLAHQIKSSLDPIQSLLPNLIVALERSLKQVSSKTYSMIYLVIMSCSFTVSLFIKPFQLRSNRLVLLIAAPRSLLGHSNHHFSPVCRD